MPFKLATKIVHDHKEIAYFLQGN